MSVRVFIRPVAMVTGWRIRASFTFFNVILPGVKFEDALRGAEGLVKGLVGGGWITGFGLGILPSEPDGKSFGGGFSPLGCCCCCTVILSGSRSISTSLSSSSSGLADEVTGHSGVGVASCDPACFRMWRGTYPGRGTSRLKQSGITTTKSSKSSEVWLVRLIVSISSVEGGRSLSQLQQVFIHVQLAFMNIVSY